MGKLLSCVLGPRLYLVQRGPGGGAGGRGDPAWDPYYQPRALEKHTDSVLALASVLWSVSYYTSPLAALYLYRKGLLTMTRMVQLSHYGATVLLLLGGVACLRGIGRWSNPQYVEFISVLEDAHRLGTPESKRKLGRFTFDFRSWPVDYRWDSHGAPWGGSRAVPLLRTPPPKLTLVETIRDLPGRLASWLLAHSLGRRLLFPGSVRLLQKALLPALLQGQARLIGQCGGRRVKLLACDGNEIDAAFVDRRGGGDPRGDTLVICCEGNAGFYEVGCLSTPLEAGYSVLGWNHPGFGGSTGVPLPQSEANAVDVVLGFALNTLGFEPQNIVLYGWSIGGFTATWAAMSYPALGGLVLDASFDHVLPLALKVLPAAWGDLVTRTVHEHLNLNNADQLCRYPGPVLLVRRTRDEIITTTVPDDIASNRGNDLLLRLLRHRYPKIMAGEGEQVVKAWLEEATPTEDGGVSERWCRAELEAFAGDRNPPFPWQLGEHMTPEERQQMALYLAQKHLQNFEGTHCTPLPPHVFRLPWSL